MEPTEGQIQIKDKTFKIFEFFKLNESFKHVDLINFKISLAKYGGPIAVARETDAQKVISFNENVKEIFENICFFSNNGTLETKVPFKEDYKKGQIVGFDFIEDEFLLIMFHTGDYFLIDPFKPQNKRLFSLGQKFKEDLILSCKVFEKGFVFMTQFITFYFVMDAKDPQVREFNSKKNMDRPKSYIPIGPKYSQSNSVELQVTDPQGGVIQYIEDLQFKYVFSKLQEKSENLPEIKNIEQILVSPTYKFFAYLTRQQDKGIVYIQSAELRGNVQQEIDVQVQIDGGYMDLYSFIQRQDQKQLLQFLWCGDDGLVFVLAKCLLLLDLTLEDPDDKEKIDKKEKQEKSLFRGKLTVYEHKISQNGVFCGTELDGMRIISKRRNEFLYKLPDSYIKIFKLLSKEPGAKIYESYQQFENKLPLEDEDIRNKKPDLIKGVEDCIEAGAYELNIEFQSKLLKAASFGKTFLNASQIDHGRLHDVCKFLRVINNIKNEKMNRTLTYTQLKNIEEEILVKILLRYNLHHLALQITNFLDFQDQGKIVPQIYEHWACCKIEEDYPEEELCQKIKEKLILVKGVSYTEIAQKAIEINKQKLASILLENEPSIPKRIPILIGMAESVKSESQNQYFEKALEESLKSCDNNLIYLVILSIMSSTLQEDYIFKLMNSGEILKSQFICNFILNQEQKQILNKVFLKNFKKEQLENYLEKTLQNNELGFYQLYSACCKKDPAILDKRLNYLKKSLKCFQKCNELDNVMIELIKQEIPITEQYIQKMQQEKKVFQLSIDDITPVSLISKYLDEDNLKEAQDIQKDKKVNEKRFNILKIKSMIKKGQTDQIFALLERENKKKIVIPYELVADLLIENNQNELAIEFLKKMPEKDISDQVEILLWLGQPREAVKAAVKAKDEDQLKDLRQKINDNSIISLIDQYYEQKKKK